MHIRAIYFSVSMGFSCMTRVIGVNSMVLYTEDM